MYKVLVCGSRYYSDYSKVLGYVRKLKDAVIISGGAKGADTLAVKAARECGLPFREYPAQWERYGRSAGPKRNAQMLEVERPHLVVAFHWDIGSSRGTKDMVEKARRSGVPVVVIK